MIDSGSIRMVEKVSGNSPAFNALHLISSFTDVRIPNIIISNSSRQFGSFR